MADISVRDLQIGEERSIRIPPAYLRRIIENRMYGDHSLEGMLFSMAEMTSFTGRENSCVVYSTIPERLEQYRSVTSIHFPDFRIVPSLGSPSSVPNPDFYSSIMYQPFLYSDGLCRIAF